MGPISTGNYVFEQIDNTSDPLLVGKGISLKQTTLGYHYE